jgi:hypothetical protein
VSVQAFASIERIIADEAYQRSALIVESQALASPAIDLVAKAQERRSRLWIVSPSQHEKCACARRWGIRYLDGIKGPDKESARMGTAMHAVLERYYLERVLPETVITPGMVAFMNPRGVSCADAIAMTESALCGLKYAPEPHASLSIEHEFVIEIAQNTTEQGKIDVYDPTRASGFRVGQFAEPKRGQEPSGWATHDARGYPIPLVVDHKSTGDFKWMKNDDVLRGTSNVRGDPQPAIYGACAVRDFLLAYGVWPEYVHFRWIYYLRSKKGKPNARAVDLRMTPQEIIGTVQTLTPEAQQLIWLAASDKQGNDLAPNLTECPKFGGCEYGPRNMNICRISDGERLRARMLQNPPPNLAAQVAAFTQQQQQPAAPQGIFGGAAPAAVAAPQGIFSAAAPQPAPQAPQGIFGGAAPAPQAQQQQPQPQQGLFNQQQAAPAAPQGFMQQAPAQQFAAPQQQQFAAPVAQQQTAPQGFMQQQQAPAQQFAPPVAPPPAPAQQFAPPPAPVVQLTQAVHDPRLSDGSIPAHVPAEKYGEYLAYVDAAGLDHRTQQPLAQGQTMYNGAIAQYAKQADGRDALMFFGADESGRNVMVQGDFKRLRAPNSGAATAPAPTGEKPKKPRKSKKNDGTAAAQQPGDEDEDESAQIVITVHAIDQLIGFLQSLKASAPQS